MINLKRHKLTLAASLLLISVISVGAFLYSNKYTEKLNLFYIDGTAYKCSKPISVKKSLDRAEPKSIEDLKNYCRPFSSSQHPEGCGPDGEYCIEYRAVIDILKREDVSNTISKYGSVRSSVKALGHTYIHDKEYLNRILPDYSSVAIDCIVVVHSPEGTRFFIESADAHKNHDDHKFIEVPSEKFLTSLNNASDKDVTAFWLGLH